MPGWTSTIQKYEAQDNQVEFILYVKSCQQTKTCVKPSFQTNVSLYFGNSSGSNWQDFKPTTE